MSNLDMDLKKIMDGMNSKADAPPERYAIERLLPRRGMVVVMGKAGYGKSSVVLFMMACACRGMSFCGKFGCEEALKILWMNLNDESGSSLKKRLYKMLNSLGVKDGKIPPNFRIFNQLDTDVIVGLHNLDEEEKLQALIDQEDPDVIVFDSLRKLVNIEKQVMNCSRLREFRDKNPNRLLVLIAHSKEKDILSSELFGCEDPGSYMANSSDLARDLDAYYVVHRHEKKPNCVDKFYLRPVGKRVPIPTGPFVIDVEQDEEMNEYYKLTFEGWYRPELPLGLKLVLDELRLANPKIPLSIGDLLNSDSKAKSLSPATIHRYVEKLRALEWIECCDSDNKTDRKSHKKYLRITPLGIANMPDV